jgi:electron transfer flavoprotein alpha subunit
MSSDVIAFAEVRDGKLKKSALEVVTAARALATTLGGKVIAVALSDAAVEGAATLGNYGADEVLVGVADSLASAAPDVIAKALAEVVSQRDPAAILLPHSAIGKDVAPRLAALVDCPQASDCIALAVEGGKITATRPVYAGKARWEVTSNAPRFLATLRPNVFTPRASGGPDAPVKELAAIAATPAAHRVEVLAPAGEKKLELTESDVIVSGGRGLKEPANFALVEELASALGAAVGASRAVVDAGWRPHGDQVGQTGKTVAPNLYVAVGISGAIQHLAGMSSSRVIVAINKDKDAPIFKVANYGIVGDLFEIVPALTAAIRTARAH